MKGTRSRLIALEPRLLGIVLPFALGTLLSLGAAVIAGILAQHGDECWFCAPLIAGGAPPPTSLRAVVEKLQLESLVQDVLAACDWITATAQVKGETLPPRTSPGAMAGAMHAYNYSDWAGSIRTEYAAASQECELFPSPRPMLLYPSDPFACTRGFHGPGLARGASHQGPGPRERPRRGGRRG